MGGAFRFCYEQFVEDDEELADAFCEPPFVLNFNACPDGTALTMVGAAFVCQVGECTLFGDRWPLASICFTACAYVQRCTQGFAVPFAGNMSAAAANNSRPLCLP